MEFSTTWHPSPASVHGSPLNDKERMKLYSTGPDTCARLRGDFTQPFRVSDTVSWLCWWCVAQEGGLLPQPQPPTSPAIANEGRYRPDPGGLIQNWWWVPPHSIPRWHDRFLRLRFADGVRLQPPCHNMQRGQPSLIAILGAQRIVLPPLPNTEAKSAAVLNVYHYTVRLGRC